MPNFIEARALLPKLCAFGDQEKIGVDAGGARSCSAGFERWLLGVGETEGEKMSGMVVRPCEEERQAVPKQRLMATVADLLFCLWVISQSGLKSGHFSPVKERGAVMISVNMSMRDRYLNISSSSLIVVGE